MTGSSTAKIKPPATENQGSGNDLRGATQLTIAAVQGVVDLVESLHGTISSLSPIVGASRTHRTRGITGLVYRSIRGVTRITGATLDTALARLTPLLNAHASMPTQPREASLAALNGIFGDFLARSGNPLAINMQLRHQGRNIDPNCKALIETLPNANGKLLILIHGLCMNDQQWQRNGHDHGRELAIRLGYTPLYLRYNSGMHISTNGAALSSLLEALVAEWPVPIEELVLLGHSMGGLVARSACQHAGSNQSRWLRHLSSMLFLGTPHHGAPLERAGSWVDLLLGISPYSAPFARLGMARSDGIRDLRHGIIDETDWQTHPSSPRADHRSPVPLPAQVACYTIAATRQHPPETIDPQASGEAFRLPVRGDGLVPVSSALGIHRETKQDLRFDTSRRKIFFDTNHFDLLNRQDVFEQLCSWLEPTQRRAARRKLTAINSGNSSTTTGP